MTIDNGNHLLLSGNHAALAYLRTHRRASALIGPPSADFSVRRSRKPASAGRCASTTAACRGGSSTPARARARHARARLSAARCRCCGRRPARRSARSIALQGPLYDRCCEPLLLAALNIDPPEGSARACRRHHPRDAGGRRHGVPAADRARGLGRRVDRAGARAISQQRGADGALRRISCARSRFARRARRGARFRRRDRSRSRADDAVILAVPPYGRGVAGARPDGADRVPRHRQRAFPHRRRRQAFRRSSACSTARSNGCSPSRAGSRSPSAPPTGCSTRRARNSPQTIWREVAQVAGIAGRRCRRGRSCASGARPSRRRRQQNAKRPGAAHAIGTISYLAGDWTRHGLARDHRRCHSLRQPRRRSGDAQPNHAMD